MSERSSLYQNTLSKASVDLSSGYSTIPAAEIASAAVNLQDPNTKFAVIDGKTVITGSFNWSPSAAHQNDEVLMLIHSPLLAAHFTREMDRLWKGAELGINPRMERKLQENRRRCGSGMQRR